MTRRECTCGTLTPLVAMLLATGCTGDMRAEWGEAPPPAVDSSPPDDPGDPMTPRDPGDPMDPSDPMDPGDPTDPEDPGLEPTRFSCDPDAAVDRDEPLRRLSRDQYEHTIQDLVARVGAPQAQEAIDDALPELLERMPVDARVGQPGDTHGGYRRLDQDVQQGHLEVSLEIATMLGEELTGTPARLEHLAGACATDDDTSNDATCVEDFIRQFGMLTHRRPLTDEDVTFYGMVFGDPGTDPAAFRDVIAVMLTSPRFLYHVEHGAEPAEDAPQDVWALDDWELASRLSYHFWQSMPDEELMEAARRGELREQEGWRVQVDRVFEDPKTARSLSSFYRQWLWMDELPQMDALVGSPRYDAFAGEDAPDESLRLQLADEIVALARHHTLEAQGSLSDLLLDDRSYATERALADLYGVEPRAPDQPPVEVPDGSRAGLITRPALLVNGSTSTRPVMKGFLIRKAMLCTTPPPPPDNAMDSEIDIRPDMTTRQVVEEITEQPGTSCAGCHQLFMNPLGFATEGFDALGRPRDVQRLFDEDGHLLNELPLDTSSIPRVLLADETPSEGAHDLMRLLESSGEVHACFARQYARFAFGRPEDAEIDGCTLESLRARLIAGEPLAEVMKSVTMRPEFRRRLIRQEDNP